MENSFLKNEEVKKEKSRETSGITNLNFGLQPWYNFRQRVKKIVTVPLLNEERDLDDTISYILASSVFYVDIASWLLDLDIKDTTDIELEKNTLVSKKDLEDEEVLVLNVGGRYEPEKLNFDHHQSKELKCTTILLAQFISKKFYGVNTGYFSADVILSLPIIEHLNFLSKNGITEYKEKFGFNNEQRDIKRLGKISSMEAYNIVRKLHIPYAQPFYDAIIYSGFDKKSSNIFEFCMNFLEYIADNTWYDFSAYKFYETDIEKKTWFFNYKGHKIAYSKNNVDIDLLMNKYNADLIIIRDKLNHYKTEIILSDSISDSYNLLNNSLIVENYGEEITIKGKNKAILNKNIEDVDPVKISRYIL